MSVHKTTKRINSEPGSVLARRLCDQQIRGFVNYQNKFCFTKSIGAFNTQRLVVRETKKNTPSTCKAFLHLQKSPSFDPFICVSRQKTSLVYRSPTVREVHYFLSNPSFLESKRETMAFEKIKVANPIVEMDGEISFSLSLSVFVSLFVYLIRK